jgi:hypothetical protein
MGIDSGIKQMERMKVGHAAKASGVTVKMTGARTRC